MDRLPPFKLEIFNAPGRTKGIADYLSRHPSPKEGECVKASELRNIWFTVNHVNNLDDILADELNEQIKRRRWLKLQRYDKRSKSAHLPIQNKQTVDCENKISNNKSKIGQTQSTNDITSSEINRFSNKLKLKLKLANQIGRNLLVANYLDNEFPQKNINIPPSAN